MRQPHFSVLLGVAISRKYRFFFSSGNSAFAQTKAGSLAILPVSVSTGDGYFGIGGQARERLSARSAQRKQLLSGALRGSGFAFSFFA
jgi:hypothetical protein